MPDKNYNLYSITAAKADDRNRTVDVSGSGNTRTFIMPEYDVVVSAEYNHYWIDVYTIDELETAFSSGGDYKLKASLISDKKNQIFVRSKVTLDLNGKTIKSGGSSTDPLIQIVNNGDLTLIDNSAKKKGKISGGNNRPCIRLNETKARLTMNDGTITGAAAEGGGVHLKSGTFIMNGGKITDCTSTSKQNTKGGGGVYVSSGKFTMNGGEITGNNAVRGGGVFIFKGTFYMNGGEITGNNAERGGGVYVYCNSKLIMYGGSIQYNSASVQCGGVYVAVNYGYQGGFRVKGETVVRNNTKNDKPNDIYLYNHNNSVYAHLIVDGRLTEDAELRFANGSDYEYVAKPATNVTLTGTDLQAFRSSNGELVGKLCNGNIILDEPGDGLSVRFNMNSHGTAPDNQFVEEGGKVTKPDTPTTEGYTFLDWYKEQKCSIISGILTMI